MSAQAEEHTLALRIAASAEASAKLLAQFDLVADISPQIAACVVDGDGVGAIRTLTMSTGLQVVERLVEDTGTGYTYELLEGPPSIEGYRIAIGVEPDGPDACRVRWRLTLSMAEGRDPAPTVDSLRALFEVGVDHCRRQLEHTPA